MGIMSKFRRDFENPDAKNINLDLIKNLRMEPMEPYIVEAFRTMESKYIKLKSWRLITDESKFEPDKVNLNYIKSKDKNKKVDVRMPIRRNRYNLLQITFNVTGLEKSKKEKKPITVNKDITLNLLTFKRIDRYYFMIGGNRYYPIYQLVETSTYNTKNFNILKSMLLPIIIKRTMTNIIDINEKEYRVPFYELVIFKKTINPLIYYAATMGLTNTLKYMNMEEIIKVNIHNRYKDDSEYLVFKTGEYYISVIKYFFANDAFVQDMTYSLIKLLEEIPADIDLDNPDYWCIIIGGIFSSSAKEDKRLEKGKGTLFSFYRLLDNITKNNLRLKECNKRNMYAVIRWMLRNFSELKAKDNMDIRNKRIRMSEYIAAFIIKRISYKMNSMLKNGSLTKLQNMKDIEQFLNFKPDFIINEVIGSDKPLVRYDNIVNDQDLFTALKYTIKGPGSLGEKSSNAINIKFRGIDPSYINRIDLNTCGTSDPGMSGCFTPFIKLYNGKYFSPKGEPESWDDEFDKMYCNYFHGKKYEIKGLEYYYAKEKKTHKALKALENIEHFIEKDPYNSENYIFDVGKYKIRKIKVSKEPKLKHVKIKRCK